MPAEYVRQSNAPWPAGARSAPFVAATIRAGLYATTAVPLLVLPETLSPFIFGKAVVFRSLIELLIPLYLVLAWHSPFYRPPYHRVAVALGIFVLASLISTATSVSVYQSFWGTLERMDGLLSLLHYFAFFILLTAVMRTERHWLIFFSALLVSASISLGLALAQDARLLTEIPGVGEIAQPYGPLGNPAFLAGYLLVGCFLSAALSMHSSLSVPTRWLYRLTAVLMGVGIVATGVRGALVAGYVGTVALLVLFALANRSRLAAFIAALIIGLPVAAILAASLVGHVELLQESPFLYRLAEISPNTHTAQSRFAAWSSGLQGWLSSPRTMFLGWGPENFNVPFSRHLDPMLYAWPGAELVFDRAHNVFVEILVTTGAIGLAAYLAVLGAVFYTLRRAMGRNQSGPVAVGILALVVAYLVHNSFIFDSPATHIAFFAVLAYILFIDRSSAAEQPSADSTQWTPLGSAKLVSLALGAVGAAFLVLTLNVRPALANWTAGKALVAARQDRFSETIGRFNQALSYQTFGIYSLRLSLAQYLLEVGERSGPLPPGYEQAVARAVAELEKNIPLHPQDHLTFLALARLHVVLGARNSTAPETYLALTYLDAALARAPKFLPAYHDLAQAYINKGQPAKAYAALQQAQALNPQLGITYWLMALVRQQLGDHAEAVGLIRMAVRKGYRLSWQDAGRAVKIYEGYGKVESLVPELERVVRNDPENPALHSILAVAYARSGAARSAIETAQRAARIDRGYENGAERLIHAIELRSLRERAEVWSKRVFEADEGIALQLWFIATARTHMGDTGRGLDLLQQALLQGHKPGLADLRRFLLRRSPYYPPQRTLSRLESDSHDAQSADVLALSAVLYGQIGDYSAARNALHEAALNSPRYRAEAIDFLRELRFRALEDQITDWFRHASTLEVDIGTAYWVLGMIRSELGDPSGALLLMRLALGEGYYPSWSESARLVAISAASSDERRTIFELRKATRNSPDDPRLLAMLAVAYKNAGYNQRARTVAEAVLRLGGRYRPGATRLLRELAAEDLKS